MPLHQLQIAIILTTYLTYSLSGFSAEREPRSCNAVNIAANDQTTIPPGGMGGTGHETAIQSGGIGGTGIIRAGNLSMANGTVIAESADKKRLELARGDAICLGDHITVADDGKAKIMFSDGAALYLLKNTVVSIDQYYYAEQEPKLNRSLISLAKGDIRSVSGAISKLNPTNYTFKTPSSIIRVIGTDFLITHLPQQEGAIAAAERGSAQAQYKVGILYDFGEGVEQDYIQAAKWYRLVVDQGLSSVQYFLGTVFAKCVLVMQDFDEAVRWYSLAAKQGYKNAIMNLGKIYAEDIEHQDYAESMKWYRLAAQDQYAPAQFSIGEIYMRQNNSQGYQQALKWYFLAAESGYAPAQFNLGEMFANGIGVVKDYPTALKWYHMAAKQANPYALASLGRLFEKGRGVPQDFALAHMWFNLSSAYGFNFAQTERDNLAQKMPPTQIAEAQAIARDYAQNYFKNKS